MSNLTKNQVEKLANEFEITEKEVLENEKFITDTLFFRKEVLREELMNIWSEMELEIKKAKKFILRKRRKM